MTSRRPSKATANKLWALCGNECANPACNETVFEIGSVVGSTDININKKGKIAHINGAKPGSNRYLPSQADEDRHGFNNLLILCDKCHTNQPDGIDVPLNENRFPAELLQKWRKTHLTKVRGLNDRNWICYPNVAIEFRDGVSTKTQYWIDFKGHPQLYTAEQLAIVNQLFPLTLSFSQIQSMIKMIIDTKGEPIDPSFQTMNDAVIRQLFQETQRIESNDYGWIGYLTETMQIAQDITLGEIFLMMVQDGLKNKDHHVKQGHCLLKEKAKLVNPLPEELQVEKK